MWNIRLQNKELTAHLKCNLVLSLVVMAPPVHFVQMKIKIGLREYSAVPECYTNIFNRERGCIFKWCLWWRGGGGGLLQKSTRTIEVLQIWHEWFVIFSKINNISSIIFGEKSISINYDFSQFYLETYDMVSQIPLHNYTDIFSSLVSKWCQNLFIKIRLWRIHGRGKRNIFPCKMRKNWKKIAFCIKFLAIWWAEEKNWTIQEVFESSLSKLDRPLGWELGCGEAGSWKFCNLWNKTEKPETEAQ